MPPRPEGEGRLIQLVAYAYIGGSWLVGMMPERLAYGIAHVAGGWAARRDSSRRRNVERNLARITGEPAGSAMVQRLVVDAYRSYARYWLETFRLVREGREFFRDRFRAPTEDNLWGVVKSHGGAIVVVGHLGNYDAAGAWVGASGYRLVTVAEVLKPRRMFDFFVEHRAKLGMTIHPAEKGVTSKLVEAVKGGAVVAVLADRDLKGTGPEVTFFGERVTFPPGAASISIATQVPIVVAGVYGVTWPDGKKGWAAEISERLPLPAQDESDGVATLTQAIATELERCVRKRPEEWHVFQPFWLADRRPA